MTRYQSRLDLLEADFLDLKAVLDDPLKLIERLRELEVQRQALPRMGETGPPALRVLDPGAE
jgi:hypothetical protein